MSARLAGLAALGMLVSAPVSASVSAGAQAPASAEGAQEEKKVCKQIVGTGTIMPKRFCMTRAQWREFNDRNGKDADQALSRRGAGACASGFVLECKSGTLQ